MAQPGRLDVAQSGRHADQSAGLRAACQLEGAAGGGTLVMFWRGAGLSDLERYERIAPLYDLLDLPFEYGRYRRIRPLLFQGLSGRVLEAGVGTGRNFPFYPPGAQIVGIDLSPAMLKRAQRRRSVLAANVDLQQMDVTRLAFADQSFDAAVA